MKDYITKNIKEGMKSITPNIYQSIKKDLKKEKKMKFKLSYLFTTLSAACTIIMLFVGLTYYNNNFKSNYIVAIDVNPSIELLVSKSDKVVKASPLNEGGIKILDNMDLKNVSLGVAVNAITGSMLKHGFLTGDDANVLITVQNDNEKVRTIIQEQVSKTIQDALTGTEVKATVLNQNLDQTTDRIIEEFARNHNISYGKALFITNLVKKDTILNKDLLAPMSLREIAELIETNKLDIKDIVDYEKDESIEENIEENIEDNNENKAITPNITKEQAKQIAYKHSLVNESDITYVSIHQDEYEYEVLFKTATKKYEYEIDVLNGKVESYETEAIKQKPQVVQNYIGEDKAKEIAFKHAGITNPKLIKVVLDTDDNIKVYEVEFVVNNHEYEYEINALTGKILDFDSEIED